MEHISKAPVVRLKKRCLLRSQGTRVTKEKRTASNIVFNSSGHLMMQSVSSLSLSGFRLRSSVP